MTVTVNGTEQDLPDGATISDMLTELGYGSAGLAVTVDGAVVPRMEHPTQVVPDGAVVEILAAVQGG